MLSTSDATPRLLIIWLSALLIPIASAQQRPMKIPFKEFEYSDTTYRTDVCDRLLASNSTTLRDSLRGLNLSVAITNYHGVPNEEAFFALDPRTKKIPTTHPGLFAVMLDELARRAGFEWRNSFYDATPVGPNTGKSWTELLQWEVAHFDIAADYWGRSAERLSHGISFPSGWYDGSIVLAAAKPEVKGPSLWSFWLPFHANVWWAIAFGIVFTAVSYYSLEKLDHRTDERLHSPLTIVFLAAITFTGHFQFRPETDPARLLSWSWSFWALIMAAAYTANLASFLVSRNAEVAGPRVRTIQDAVERKTPVCVQRGAVIDEYLSDQFPTLQLIRKDSVNEVFSGLKRSWYGGNGGCGVVLTNLYTFDIFQTQLEHNADCSLTSEKRVISELPAGFATAMDSGSFCTSLISHVLDLHLVEMRAEGFIDAAWDAHLKRISTIQCPATTSSSAALLNNEMFSLGLSELGGIFILHSVLSVLAVCVALAEYWRVRRTQPRKQRKPIFPSSRFVSRNLVLSGNLVPGFPRRRQTAECIVDEENSWETGNSARDHILNLTSRFSRRQESKAPTSKGLPGECQPAALPRVGPDHLMPDTTQTAEETAQKLGDETDGQRSSAFPEFDSLDVTPALSQSSEEFEG